MIEGWVWCARCGLWAAVVSDLPLQQWLNRHQVTGYPVPCHRVQEMVQERRVIA